MESRLRRRAASGKRTRMERMRQMSIRQKLYDLKAKRAGYISAAEAALEADNQEEYRTNMDAAKALNGQLDALQADLEEAERYDKLVPAGGKAPEEQKAMTVEDLRGLSAKEINERWSKLQAQSK